MLGADLLAFPATTAAVRSQHQSLPQFFRRQVRVNMCGITPHHAGTIFMPTSTSRTGATSKPDTGESGLYRLGSKHITPGSQPKPYLPPAMRCVD